MPPTRSLQLDISARWPPNGARNSLSLSFALVVRALHRGAHSIGREKKRRKRRKEKEAAAAAKAAPADFAAQSSSLLRVAH